MVRSPQLRCMEGSNADVVGRVISPDLKKPKKQIVAAAHSTVLSGLVGKLFQYERNFNKIAGVIGSLIRDVH